MKYKVIGLMCCFCAILIAVIAPTFSAAKKQRYEQHLEAEEKAACTHGSDVFCTHLPIVTIETGGIEIPGYKIMGLDENGNSVVTGYTTAPDGSEMLTATLSVINNYGTNNHLIDEPELVSQMNIRRRGQTSRGYDKAGYLIKLIEDDGSNNDQKVIGMDAHHEWTLHGPYDDKTMMRNYMWYNISGEIMDYAPNVRFCELFLDGEYRGIYVLTETITEGDKDARLPLLIVDNKTVKAGGYLLCLDRKSLNDLKNIKYYSKFDDTLTIEYPGSKYLTEDLKKEIAEDFELTENAIYSDNKSSDYSCSDYIDIKSFADYFLINELTVNYDAGRLSTYIYKGTDGKYRLCVWDFNNSCDNYHFGPLNRECFDTQHRLIFEKLMKDEEFVNALILEYKELRQTYFSEEYLDNYIDDVVEYLGDSVDRNFEKWDMDYHVLRPVDRNPSTYEEAVQDLKDLLHDRIEWMDANIDSLRNKIED